MESTEDSGLNAPVRSRQWVLSWLKATAVVRVLWREGEGIAADDTSHPHDDKPQPPRDSPTPRVAHTLRPRRLDLEPPVPPDEAEDQALSTATSQLLKGKNSPPPPTTLTPTVNSTSPLPTDAPRPPPPPTHLIHHPQTMAMGPRPKLPRFAGNASLEAFRAQFDGTTL
ncbi:UNVERIFIED_CONTAM: hypothetical protein FKN15_075742 [Acipenser sinensis]